MKYKVELGLMTFEIEDGHTAISFAELAKAKFVPTEYTKSLKPRIELVDEKEEEEDA